MPHPLNEIGILFSMVSPYDAHLLLRNIWWYLYENDLSQIGVTHAPMPGKNTICYRPLHWFNKNELEQFIFVCLHYLAVAD